MCFFLHVFFFFFLAAEAECFFAFFLVHFVPPLPDDAPVPWPLSATVGPAVGASRPTVPVLSVPVFGPVLDGLNETLIVQLADAPSRVGARDAGQSEVAAKSPVVAMLTFIVSVGSDRQVAVRSTQLVVSVVLFAGLLLPTG